MKMMSYKNALKLGKEKFQEALVPAKVKSAKKKAELEMCKLEEDIATKEAELHELCGCEDVDFAKIIDKQNSIALLERRKKQYQTILDQMFPEDD